ncbi:hypothetical protein EVAR_14388_1 [Eumeta japonica]|uniref:Uncharacterized protein n=1 Tax=Eumeta variegata TaxID=151549 RepID=A0A4C1TXG3_EUMVA|nr:hypothetical protein EVAR_14388_1 [Eumeta japonica]
MKIPNVARVREKKCKLKLKQALAHGLSIALGARARRAFHVSSTSTAFLIDIANTRHVLPPRAPISDWLLGGGCGCGAGRDGDVTRSRFHYYPLPFSSQCARPPARPLHLAADFINKALQLFCSNWAYSHCLSSQSFMRRNRVSRKKRALIRDAAPARPRLNGPSLGAILHNWETSKMGLSAGGGLSLFCGGELGQPPPAHMGIPPPYQLDSKLAAGLARTPMYPFPGGTYPYPMLSPEMSQVAASWHTPSMYPISSAASGFRSPYPTSLPITSSSLTSELYRFSPTLGGGLGLGLGPALVPPPPTKADLDSHHSRYARRILRCCAPITGHRSWAKFCIPYATQHNAHGTKCFESWQYTHLQYVSVSHVLLLTFVKAYIYA